MGFLDFLDPFDVLDDLFEDPADTAKKNAGAAITQSQDFYDQFLDQFIAPAKSKHDMAWDVALGFAEDVPETLTTGYDRARVGIDRMASQGRADILDMEENSRAGAGQTFASRGLYGSGAHGGALDGVTSSTARALGTLQSMLAGQYSSLETGRAHALSGAFGNLANMHAGRAGSELQFMGQQVGAAMGAPVFADPGGLPPWLQGGIGLIDAIVPG